MPTCTIAGLPTSGEASAPQSVRLLSTFVPVPAKLVTKIRSGQFIELRELLADNVALQRQLDTIHGQPAFPLPAMARPRMREIVSPQTWAYCFLAYVAVRAADPVTRDLLTSGRLMIREAQRHPGAGWLEYDRVFRQQAALVGQPQWNELNPSLFAATVLSARTDPAPFTRYARRQTIRQGSVPWPSFIHHEHQAVQLLSKRSGCRLWLAPLSNPPTLSPLPQHPGRPSGRRHLNGSVSPGTGAAVPSPARANSDTSVQLAASGAIELVTAWRRRRAQATRVEQALRWARRTAHRLSLPHSGTRFSQGLRLGELL